MFLDRDGTINVSPPPGEYLTRPDDVKLIDGAALAIRRLNQAGIWVGIATNQRGIALGLMTLEDLERVHERLQELLRAAGATLDALYVCPHGIGMCDCRKPLPGLLRQARREVPALDFARAAMIGDSPADVEAGRAAGTTTVLLSSADDASGDGSADYTAASLDAALDWLAVPPRSDGWP